MPRKSISTGKNRGMKYEEKINDFLKKINLQNDGTSSGGTTKNPDGYFIHEEQEIPFEIKKDLTADFAQIELSWDSEKRFQYSDKTTNKEFKQFLENNTDFLREINEKWTKEPRKFTKQNLTSEDRNYDLDNFPDIKKEVDVSYIEEFYCSKNPPINYIQIGKKGFYFLKEDVLRMDVPRLNGKPILRARVKTRDIPKNKWGFLVAIKLKGVKSSIYDIEELREKFIPFNKRGDDNHLIF